MTVTLHIEREAGEIPVSVECDYRAAGRRDFYGNFDPEEFAITEAYSERGAETLTAREQETALEKCREHYEL